MADPKRKAELEKGVKGRMVNDAQVSIGNHLQKQQTRYSALNPVMTQEQEMRAPFGSEIPLTSFSKQSKFFRDHAYHQATAEKKIADELKRQRQSKRQEDWRVALLTELEVMQQPNKLGNAISRGPKGAIEALKMHEKAARRLLTEKANPDAHKKYTQTANMAPLSTKTATQFPAATDALKAIENKVRSSVLKQFLRENTKNQTDETRLLAELAEAKKVKSQLEGSVRSMVLLLKLRSRTVVTKEMIRVLFYSLDSVVEVERIFFTPVRDECYVKFTYDCAVSDGGALGLSSQHDPRVAIQTLVEELTSEAENPFFEAHKSVKPSEAQYHHLAIRHAIQTALKRTLVVNASWQQMKNVMDRYSQMHVHRQQAQPQPRAQPSVFWPEKPMIGRPRGPPLERGKTQVVRVRQVDPRAAAKSRYVDQLSHIKDIPVMSTAKAKTQRIQRERKLEQMRSLNYEASQAHRNFVSALLSAPTPAPKTSKYHAEEQEAEKKSEAPVPRFLAHTSAEASAIAGNLEWTLTRSLEQNDWDEMVKAQNDAAERAALKLVQS